MILLNEPYPFYQKNGSQGFLSELEKLTNLPELSPKLSVLFSLEEDVLKELIPSFKSYKAFLNPFGDELKLISINTSNYIGDISCFRTIYTPPDNLLFPFVKMGSYVIHLGNGKVYPAYFAKIRYNFERFARHCWREIPFFFSDERNYLQDYVVHITSILNDFYEPVDWVWEESFIKNKLF